MHGSKGGEADFVFLINMNFGKYGFPSQIVDEPLLSLAKTDNDDTFPFSEERRLLYVGMTRAKRMLFLISNRYMISQFSEEIAHDESISFVDLTGKLYPSNKQPRPITCPNPNCQSGFLIRKKGRYGRFWGCSNYPDCKYTNSVDS